MVDQRIAKTAQILVEHSARVKKGEVVEIAGGPETAPLIQEIYRLCIKKGAFPRVEVGIPKLAYYYYHYASHEQLTNFPKIAHYIAHNTDAYIGLGGTTNTRELSTIPPKKLVLRRKVTERINKIYLKKKWVIFEYPTPALAQEADMSLEEFEDFVYGAVIQDWKKEEKRQTKLKKILDRGRRVRIVGKNTDIQFSIAGRQAIKSYGLYNMPSGEVFIAPVETTTEGHIEYSFPAIYSGKEVDGITLEFKKGKVVHFSAKKNVSLLKEMLAIDRGASYLGEFGIGTNYRIKNFVKQILFDEKIGGTIHLALGMAYEMGGGRNKSALHWDMIKDLRKGGEVYVDGKIIQKNGKFVKGVW